MCWLSPSPISRMVAASFSSRTVDEVVAVGNAPPPAASAPLPDSVQPGAACGRQSWQLQQQ